MSDIKDVWNAGIKKKEKSGELLEEQATNIVIHTLNEIQGVENKEEQALYTLGLHIAMVNNFMAEQDMVEAFDAYAEKIYSEPRP